MGSSAPTENINHNNQIPGYTTTHAAEMYATSVAGIIANGSLSLGQTVVGSTDANTTSNYIICKSNFTTHHRT